MALSRFILPFADVGSGIKPSSGAQLFFYETGTSTLKDTFTDASGTIPNANPVIANASGVFGDIFITDTYKVVLQDKNNSQIWEADPVTSTSASELSVIARSLNVLDSQVIYSTDTTTVLDNVLYIYDSGQQITWAVPTLNGLGETIVSVIGDQLTTTGDTYTLEAVGTRNQALSPEDFGAVGDGVTDDTPAFQNAVDSFQLGSVGLLQCSSNAIYLIKGLSLPNTSFTIDFSGATVEIDGSDGILYSDNLVTPSDGYQVQNIKNGRFNIKTNHTAIKVHQIWDAAYKDGPTISGNVFKIFDAATTVNSVVSLSGLANVNILNNLFNGNYAKVDQTCVRYTPQASETTSVMNLNARGNRFLNVTNGIYMDDIITPAGGHAEGWIIADNTFVGTHGVCIRTHRCLIMNVNNNLLSQIGIGISTSSTHCSITDNVIEGVEDAGIELQGFTGHIIEDINMSDNIIKLKNAASIALRFASTQDFAIRLVTCNNLFIYGTGGMQLQNGIVFTGDFICSSMKFISLSASWLDNVFYSTISDGKIRGNYTAMTFESCNVLHNNPAVFTDTGISQIGRFQDSANLAILDTELYDVFSARQATSVTGFTTSNNGQFATIINNSGATKTIVFSSSMLLSGNIDFDMPPLGVLTMVQVATQWVEVSRRV